MENHGAGLSRPAAGKHRDTIGDGKMTVTEKLENALAALEAERKAHAATKLEVVRLKAAAIPPPPPKPAGPTTAAEAEAMYRKIEDPKERASFREKYRVLLGLK